MCLVLFLGLFFLSLVFFFFTSFEEVVEAEEAVGAQFCDYKGLSFTVSPRPRITANDHSDAHFPRKLLVCLEKIYFSSSARVLFLLLLLFVLFLVLHKF